MAIRLSTSPDFKIFLDPVRSDDGIWAVAFDAVIEVAMSYQTARIESKECWFTHDALNEFEDQLLRLCSSTTGVAALVDIYQRSVIQITRNGDRIDTKTCVTDTVQLFVTTVQAQGYASDLSALHDQLNSYEKWW